jgi:hypothetical protein
VRQTICDDARTVRMCLTRVEGSFVQVGRGVHTRNRTSEQLPLRDSVAASIPDVRAMYRFAAEISLSSLSEFVTTGDVPSSSI